MSRWVRDPEFATDERVLWHRNANREQGALRQVGGRLFLTNKRLLFVPNHFDERTGGEAWDACLEDIVDVAVHRSRPTFPFLGLTARVRRRLQIEQRDGSVEMFVVNGLDEAVGTLRTATERRFG